MIFSVFSARLRRIQDLYRIDSYDKKWQLALDHHRRTMYSAFFKRICAEVVLGKSHLKLKTKYRQIGIHLYWQYIRARYLKNVAIKEHRMEKPLALKKKCFKSIKMMYLRKKEN